MVLQPNALIDEAVYNQLSNQTASTRYRKPPTLSKQAPAFANNHTPTGFQLGPNFGPGSTKAISRD
jgi:hypothetical protein